MSSKVNQLQMLQQNMQNILVQKQQVESQLTELNSALNELDSTDKAYKIMGKVMIESSKEKLKEELGRKKEIIQIHFDNFIKQEEKIKQNMEVLQQEVIKELKESKKNEQTS